MVVPAVIAPGPLWWVLVSILTGRGLRLGLLVADPPLDPRRPVRASGGRARPAVRRHLPALGVDPAGGDRARPLWRLGVLPGHPGNVRQRGALALQGAALTGDRSWRRGARMRAMLSHTPALK